MKKALITLLFIISAVFAKSQHDIYIEYWNNPEISSIMVDETEPQALDRLRELDTDLAKFEMAQLCFSLGLYRQAEQYFLTNKKSDLRDIYIAQVKMILNENESANEYLKSVSTEFNGLKSLLQYKIGKEAGIPKSSYFNRYVLNEKKIENYNQSKSPSSDKNSPKKNSNNSEQVKLSSGDFTLQFGVFIQESRAKDLAEKIENHNFRTFIITKTIDSKPHYVLLGGRFSGIEQAEQKANILEGNYIYKIVKID